MMKMENTNADKDAKQKDLVKSRPLTRILEHKQKHIMSSSPCE